MKKLLLFLGLALLVVGLTAVLGDAVAVFQASAMCLASAPIAYSIDSPSHIRIKAINEKRGKLHKQMKDLHAKAVAEKRGFTADEDSQYQKMGNDWDELEKQLALVTAEAKRDAAMAEVDLQREETRKKNESREEAVAKGAINFRDWFLKQDVREVEMRAVNVGDDGAYVIPTGFMKKVDEAMLAYGGVYSVADVYKTLTGNDIPYPTINDTGNVGAVLAEATTIGTSVDPTLGSLTLKAYKVSSKPILVTHEMLQDNAIELENRIAKMVATRIMRGANALFTTGAGTTTIQGVVTGETSSGITPTVSAITYDNLIDLMHSVDPEYRTNGKWMFNDATLKAIRKLKDGNSIPIWQPNVQLNAPQILLGKEYVVNQSMADIGASAKSVLFGDFSKYLIREVQNPLFLRLKERYADLGQEAFILFKRFDGQVLDAGTHPIKYWTHAAS